MDTMREDLREQEKVGGELLAVFDFVLFCAIG